MTNQFDYQKAFDEFGRCDFDDRLELENVLVVPEEVQHGGTAEEVMIVPLKIVGGRSPGNLEVKCWLRELARNVNERLDELRGDDELIQLEQHPDLRDRGFDRFSACYKSKIGMVYLCIDREYKTSKTIYQMRTFFHVQKLLK